MPEFQLPPEAILMQHKCLVPYLVSGGSLLISSQQILPAFGTYVMEIRCYHGGSRWTVASPWACWDLADHQQHKPFHE